MAFTACNPTPGTAITDAQTTAFSATAALLGIRNAGQKKVRPRRIRLIAVAPAASTTSLEFRIAIDTGTARYASGGSLLTATNTDMTSSATAGAQVRFGALVMNAASAD